MLKPYPKDRPASLLLLVFNFSFSKHFLCMGVLPTRMSVHHVCTGQKRLLLGVSQPVGTGNGTLFLWRAADAVKHWAISAAPPLPI